MPALPALQQLRKAKVPVILLLLLGLEPGVGGAQPGCEWRWIDALGNCPVACPPPHFCPCYWCPK